MVLGATSRDILITFSLRGLAVTLLGLVIGLTVSVAAERLMTTLLYSFRPGYVPIDVAVFFSSPGDVRFDCAAE